MKYRLLVDSEVIDFLLSSPEGLRTRLLGHLERLRVFPSRYADYPEVSPAGRHLQVSIFAGYSLHYWVDDADGNIMVLDIQPADK